MQNKTTACLKFRGKSNSSGTFRKCVSMCVVLLIFFFFIFHLIYYVLCQHIKGEKGQEDF